MERGGSLGSSNSNTFGVDVLFGSLEHEFMIIGDVTVDSVNHLGVRMAGKRRDDVRINTGEQFASDEAVAKIVVPVALAEFGLQFLETAFDCKGGPGPTSCVSENGTGGVFGHPSADDIKRSFCGQVDDSRLLLSFRFFGGEDTARLLEFYVTGFNILDFWRAGTGVIGDNQEVREFFIGDVLKNVIKLGRSNDTGTRLSLGLLHPLNGVLFEITILDCPIEDPDHCSDGATLGSGVPILDLEPFVDFLGGQFGNSQCREHLVEGFAEISVPDVGFECPVLVDPEEVIF